jgi:glycosyltransferase involved in cell wall biosynthesis
MTIEARPHGVVLHRPGTTPAAVTVVMTCHNDGHLAVEALPTVAAQTEPALDLVIVDDCSRDETPQQVAAWLHEHAAPPLERILVVRHDTNHGLSQARNTAVALAQTPYVFILDADNQIYPRAIRRLREALEVSGRAMAYSLVETFEEEAGIIGNSIWDPERFAYGNYIDAMALIRREVLEAVGGYREMPFRFGWEDYDLWCSLVDRGLAGCFVPEILCRYRVRGASMLRTRTREAVLRHGDAIKADMEAHHTFKFHF